MGLDHDRKQVDNGLDLSGIGRVVIPEGSALRRVPWHAAGCDIVSVAWEDLLSMSFEEMPCADACETILRRLGYSVPASAWGEQNAWIKLGGSDMDATRLGDVVVSDPEQLGRPSHVAVLVDEAKHLFLTSIRNAGVVAMRGRAMRPVLGAYRLRGVAP